MPQEAVLYVAEGLKYSLSTKRATEDRARREIEEEKRQLEERLDRLYEDKLDGAITKAFYEHKAEEYTAKIEALTEQIGRMTKASLDYYDFGSRVLELAQKASFLYEKSNPEEKQELLNALLSNSTLKDRKPLIQYKKPFERILERASCSDWLRTWDEVGTYIYNVNSNLMT